MKTLIGLGCSHTQGSAFVKNFNSKDELGERTQIVPELEFASDELKKQLAKQNPYVDWNKNTILLDEILDKQSATKPANNNLENSKVISKYFNYTIEVFI